MPKKRRITPPLSRPQGESDTRGIMWWTDVPAEVRRTWTPVDYFREFFRVFRPEALAKVEAFLTRARRERPHGHRGKQQSLLHALALARVPVSAVLYVLEQTIWATYFPPRPVKESWADIAKDAAKAVKLARKLQSMKLFFTQADVRRFEQCRQVATQYSQGGIVIRASSTSQDTGSANERGRPARDDFNAALAQLHAVMKRYSGKGRPALIARILELAGGESCSLDERDLARRMRKLGRFQYEVGTHSLWGYDQHVAQMRDWGVLDPPSPFFPDEPIVSKCERHGGG